jgi:hypothetical protein
MARVESRRQMETRLRIIKEMIDVAEAVPDGASIIHALRRKYADLDLQYGLKLAKETKADA